MKYVFHRNSQNLSDWSDITRQMQATLSDTINGVYSEEELHGFFTRAIHDARPTGGGLFWGFDDPQTMPGDARCDFFYRPTYIMTLTLVNAVLQYPQLLNLPQCGVTLHGALVGCTGRGLAGHGYDSQAELFYNLKLFLNGNILAFISAYPDLSKEFSMMLNEILGDVKNAYKRGEHVGDWNQDFKADQEEILSMWPDAVSETPSVEYSDDRFLYFAYGSNMDEAWMTDRCPHAELVDVIAVPGWRFALDSSGAATILPDEASSVEGLLWSVTPEDIRSLDRHEGIKSGCYRKETLPMDICGRKQMALVYLSNREPIQRDRRKDYMPRVVQAATVHGLSREYIRMLEGFLSDAERA